MTHQVKHRYIITKLRMQMCVGHKDDLHVRSCVYEVHQKQEMSLQGVSGTSVAEDALNILNQPTPEKDKLQTSYFQEIKKIK